MADLFGPCPACGHVWLVAKLPMGIERAAELGRRAACAMCGNLKPLVADMPDDAARPGPGEAPS